MAVIPNPLPIQPPPALGTDKSAISRLWDATVYILSLVRRLLSGDLIEWHADEPVDDVATPVLHGLRRRPFGWVVVGQADAIALAFNREAATELAVAPKTASGTTRVSFVLF